MNEYDWLEEPCDYCQNNIIHIPSGKCLKCGSIMVVDKQ